MNLNYAYSFAMLTVLSTITGHAAAEDGGRPAEAALIGGGAATVAGLAGAVWRGPTSNLVLLAPMGAGLLLGAAISGTKEHRQSADDARLAPGQLEASRSSALHGEHEGPRAPEGGGSSTDA